MYYVQYYLDLINLNYRLTRRRKAFITFKFILDKKCARMRPGISSQEWFQRSGLYTGSAFYSFSYLTRFNFPLVTETSYSLPHNC